MHVAEENLDTYSVGFHKDEHGDIAQAISGV